MLKSISTKLNEWQLFYLRLRPMSDITFCKTFLTGNAEIYLQKLRNEYWKIRDKKISPYYTSKKEELNKQNHTDNLATIISRTLADYTDEINTLPELQKDMTMLRLFYLYLSQKPAMHLSEKIRRDVPLRNKTNAFIELIQSFCDIKFQCFVSKDQLCNVIFHDYIQIVTLRNEDFVQYHISKHVPSLCK